MNSKCVLLQLMLLLIVCASAQSTLAASKHIHEKRFITINGIEQWVTIKGDPGKPLILFLHDGPGSPLSPFADSIYGAWEKDFMLVQWDQRGAGRTFGRNAPKELTINFLRTQPLTIEQITSDGIELTKFLTRHFDKQKIILFATSWGTVPGIKMIRQAPDLFYGYIGHSQVVDPVGSDSLAYQKLQQLAGEANDMETIRLLDAIGKPPYDTARNAGRFIRIVKKYQQKNEVPAPASWFQLPAEYDNETDNQYHSDGDDYSFVNYTGDRHLGIAGMKKEINFFKDDLEFKIPVYFIQGEEDMQTPAAINRAYFEQIKASDKKFILLPLTAHGFNQAVVAAHYDILTRYRYIVPAIDAR